MHVVKVASNGRAGVQWIPVLVACYPHCKPFEVEAEVDIAKVWRCFFKLTKDCYWVGQQQALAVIWFELILYWTVYKQVIFGNMYFYYIRLQDKGSFYY
jgi:hypothetical protein